MQRSLLLIAAAALAAVLLWLCWPTAPLDPGSDREPTPPPSNGTPPPIATASPGAGVQIDSLPADARIATASGGEATELVVEVRGADGTVRPATTVLVAPALLADPWQQEHQGRTDAAGKAHFRLPGGTYRCRTPLGGACQVTFGPGEFATARIDLPAGVDLHGRVVDPHGAPIAGAEVLAVDDVSAARAYPVARSGDDGAFVLRDFAANCYLAARHADFAPSAPLLAEAGGGNAIEIVLSPTHVACSGIVVDVGGNPVAAAFVMLGIDQQALPAADSRASAPPMQLLLTDADGRFVSAPLPPLAVAIAAQKDGVGIAARRTVRAGADDVRLDLRPGATVTGVARAADGQPLAGVFVWNAPLHAFGCRITSTDANGTYQLRDVAPGRADLNAQLPPGVATGAQLDLIEGGVAVWNPVLSAAAAAAVRGRVVDADDKPQPQWRVVAHLPGDTRGFGAETEADGRFEIRGLPKGAVVQLAALPPKAGWTGFPAATLDGVEVGGAEVVLAIGNAMARGRLDGLVLGEDEVGVQATVRLQHDRFAAVALYRTDNAGRIAIDDLPAGQVRIEIEAPQFARLRLDDVSVPPGSGKDLGTVHLVRGGRIVGRLLDRDGRSPATATVVALDPQGRLAEQVACVGADYATSLLPAGNYTLLIQAEGYGPARIAAHIVAGRQETIDVTLQSGVAHTIAVATREPTQQSAMTSILLFDARGEPLWFGHLAMQGGLAEFALFLEQGDYQLRALGVDGYSATATFTVSDTAGPGDRVTQVELMPPR